MSEEPKSIWKISWNGWSAILIWCVLVVIAVLLAILIDAIGKEVEMPAGSVSMASVFITTAFIFYGILVILLLRWLICKHWRKTLFGLACFATLIALFYAEEDWRGRHAWNKYQKEWEAKGEYFDFASVIPPPVPEDQNFAMSPVWIAEEKYFWQNEPKKAEAWYGDRIYSDDVSKILPLLPVTVSALAGTNWAHAVWPPTPEVTTHWTTAQMTDLKPWQSYYRDLEKTNPAVKISIAPQPQSPASDVLLALSKYDPVIEKLRTDIAMQYSRFPLNYDEQPPAAILLPHLSALKQWSQVLQLHSIAELQNGESEKALDDVKLSLRLADSIHTEPILISHLVRIAILEITLQSVYEGLAEHKWSDVQLTDLDSELAKLDFLADYKFAIRGERALSIGNIEFLRHPRLSHSLAFKAHTYIFWPRSFLFWVQMLSYLSDDNGESSPMYFQTFALMFGPSGWLDQNELRIAQFETKWCLPIVDEDTETISPARVRAADNTIKQEIRHRTPENVFEESLMPALGGAANRFAYTQSSVDLARVAIALERYRLVHGNYPESLDVLAPQFIEKLPHDIIGGQPLHYRRTDDGLFVLYSVGWNELDDGGVVVLTKHGSADRDKGDWVWRYPQK